MYSKDIVAEITSYIKKNLKKGYTKESLRWALVSQGYSKMEIQRAFERADKELSAEAPILKTKPEIEYKATPIVEEKKSFWKKWFG